MRILIIAKTWGSEGGIEQYLIGIVGALSQFGHEVILMCARKSDRIAEGPNSVSTLYEITSLDEFPNRDNFGTVEDVLGIVEKENIDIIYIHELKNYSVLSALVACRPTVARFHGCIATCIRYGAKTFYLSRKICTHKLGIWCYVHGCFLGRHVGANIWNKFISIFHAKRRLAAYRKVQKALVASNYMKNEFLRHGFDNQKVVVLPYPTDIPEIDTETLNYSNNTILFVGRIDRYKGVDVLLKSLPLIKHDFEAVIIGEGDYVGKCKLISKKLGLQDKVKFVGWVPNEELRNYYLKSTLMVVPSIWTEAFGIVGIEAMSYARPVVAFDVGGISDWLKDGETGYLVRRMDYDGLANKMTLLLKDKVLARNLGMNGYKRCAEEFDRRKYMERLLLIFQSVIDEYSREGH